MIVKLSAALQSIVSNQYLEERHMENLVLLKDKGFQVIDIDKKEYLPELTSQSVTEYLCKKGEWQFIVKDMMFLEDTEGTLALQSMKNMNTSEVFEVYVDLRGNNTPIERLDYLFKAIEQGCEDYVNKCYHLFLALETSDFVVQSKLKKEAYRMTGHLELLWEGHQMYLTPIENEKGKRLVCLSNNINWRSSLQNGNKTTGMLLKLETTGESELMNAIRDFKEILERPEPIANVYEEAYRQAYCS